MLSLKRLVQMSGALALTTAAVGMVLAGAGGLVGPVPGGVGSLGQLLVVAGVLVSTVGYVAIRESRPLVRSDPEFTLQPTDGGNALAVTLAAPLTWWFAVDAGVGAIVGAALVGLLVHHLVPAYDVPAYCGAFVGMISPNVLSSYAAVTVAGALAGVGFVAAKRVFGGVGGKLGTTAFVGCGVVVLTTGATPADGATLPAPGTATLLIGVAAIAAVATFVVSVRLDSGPVVGSAIVGLVAGLAAPSLLPAGETVAAAAFCASFTGMAQPARIPTETKMLFAGLVTGVIFVGAIPYFGGLGGKLGTIAFAASLSTLGLLVAGRVARADEPRMTDIVFVPPESMRIGPETEKPDPERTDPETTETEPSDTND